MHLQVIEVVDHVVVHHGRQHVDPGAADPLGDKGVTAGERADVPAAAVRERAGALLAAAVVEARAAAGDEELARELEVHGRLADQPARGVADLRVAAGPVRDQREAPVVGLQAKVEVRAEHGRTVLAAQPRLEVAAPASPHAERALGLVAGGLPRPVVDPRDRVAERRQVGVVALDREDPLGRLDALVDAQPLGEEARERAVPVGLRAPILRVVVTASARLIQMVDDPPDHGVAEVRVPTALAERVVEPLVGVDPLDTGRVCQARAGADLEGLVDRLLAAKHIIAVDEVHRLVALTRREPAGGRVDRRREPGAGRAYPGILRDPGRLVGVGTQRREVADDAVVVEVVHRARAEPRLVRDQVADRDIMPARVGELRVVPAGARLG